MKTFLLTICLGLLAGQLHAQDDATLQARACLALAKAQVLATVKATPCGIKDCDCGCADGERCRCLKPKKTSPKRRTISRGPAPRCTSCSSACTCGCQDGERCDCIYDGELRNGDEATTYRPVAYTPPGTVRQPHYVPGPNGDEFRPLRYVGVPTPMFQPAPMFSDGFGGGGRFFGGGGRACRGGG